MPKENPKCERCGKEILSQPIMIDTNTLTGKADYWRVVPRRIKLCNDCCNLLSKCVEKFMLMPGYMKTKYDLKT